MRIATARAAKNRIPTASSRVQRGRKLVRVTLEGRVVYLRPQAVKILRAARKLKGAL